LQLAVGSLQWKLAVGSLQWKLAVSGGVYVHSPIERSGGSCSLQGEFMATECMVYDSLVLAKCEVDAVFFGSLVSFCRVNARLCCFF